MRHLMALVAFSFAVAFGSAVALADCAGMHTASTPDRVASTDQAAPSTKVVLPQAPKSGS
jgi:hypothetical protein